MIRSGEHFRRGMVVIGCLITASCGGPPPSTDVDLAPADYVGNRLERIWNSTDACEDGYVPWIFESAIREIENPLVQAAILQDHERINSLLGEGMDVNSRDMRDPRLLGASWTPLMASLYFGSIPTSQLLVAAGADPMAVDAHGKTIVHLAAQANVSVEVLKCAIDLYGVESISLKDLNGETPAFLAVPNSCHAPAKIQYLAQRGADLNVVRDDGKTLRSIAEELELEEVVAALDDLGVNN